MEKPKSLRAALMAAVPSLAQNPDLFWMVIPDGQIHARNLGAPSGFEWGYTLEVTLVDTIEDPSRIAFAINQWAAQNQPDLLAAPGIPFEASLVDSDKVDLVFRLRLRETMALVQDGAGGQALQSQPEPDLGALFDAAFAASPGARLKSASGMGMGAATGHG